MGSRLFSMALPAAAGEGEGSFMLPCLKVGRRFCREIYSPFVRSFVRWIVLSLPGRGPIPFAVSHPRPPLPIYQLKSSPGSRSFDRNVEQENRVGQDYRYIRSALKCFFPAISLCKLQRMRNLNKVITKLRNSKLTMPCNIAARRVAAGGGNWGRLSKLLDNIPAGNEGGRSS